MYKLLQTSTLSLQKFKKCDDHKFLDFVEKVIEFQHHAVYFLQWRMPLQQAAAKVI